MFQDNLWEPWQPASTQKATQEANAHRDARDLVHEYALRLNQVIARSQSAGLELAQRQLERVPRPGGCDLESALLLDRKRIELLEFFQQARHEISFPEPVALDDWLAFFFASAEMAGSAAVTLFWSEPGRAAEQVAADDAARLRARLRRERVKLDALRELNHASGIGLAGLDVATGCLTLSGRPFFVEQSQRLLDGLAGAAPLSFAISYDRSRDMQEGTIVAVQATFRNLSQDYLVLEALGTSHPYDQREVFNRPSLGSLTYDEAADRYTYQTAAPGVTGASFHTMVLRPGESRFVMLNLKMLDGGTTWREFQLSYRRLGEAEFAAGCYVPVPGPVDQFPPNVIYAPLASVDDPSRVDLSRVVLRSEAPCHTGRWAYPFHVGRRPFSLEQARRLLPSSCEPVHFSRWQQAWVLRTAEGCALVTPTRVTAYPRVEPEAFVLIDEAEQRVPVRFDDALLGTFMGLPLGIMDWESHRLGLSVSLPKLKLTPFFQELERLGLSLRLTQNLLGRRSLWVQPDVPARI